MSKLYIQSNETGLVVATVDGSSNEACEAKAAATYGSDDYSWGYNDYSDEPQADSIDELQAED